MKISLLISTYERPDALAAVLRSVERQTLPPHDIVIGDDGSGGETKAVIREAAARGLPITHQWHEHDGVRIAKVRNRCFAAAAGNYAAIIDGDIVLHPKFAARLFHAKIRRLDLRFAALCCHLHHSLQSRESLENNDALLARTVAQGLIRCEHGWNLHVDNTLDSFLFHQKPPD